jgi:hypothetical protein
LDITERHIFTYGSVQSWLALIVAGAATYQSIGDGARVDGANDGIIVGR